MSIRINKSQKPTKSKHEHPRQRGHVVPRKPLIDLNEPGRLRSAHVLALLGISHSTMYQRLKTGDGSIPRPDGKDGGRNYWNTETIREFLSKNSKVVVAC